MARLSDLDDKALLHEYRRSIERLAKLDPALPKAMHDIRAKYRDYVARELIARGLLTPDMNDFRTQTPTGPSCVLCDLVHSLC